MAADNQRKMPSSAEYWEMRYRRGGHSGSGSYGRLAQFKALVINDFVKKRAIGSVVEFGVGDGHQLSLLDLPEYLGLDVSPFIIAGLQDRFWMDKNKVFKPLSEYRGETAELALSLDVIFHLVEDEVFEEYMARLFQAGEKHVIIYSSNQDAQETQEAAFFRHRRFTDWIGRNITGWSLAGILKNPYPYDGADPANTSVADFYLYRKNTENV